MKNNQQEKKILTIMDINKSGEFLKMSSFHLYSNLSNSHHNLSLLQKND